MSRDTSVGKNDVMKKFMIFIFLLLIFGTIASSAVDAAAMDSIRSFWQKMRVYVLSGPFWVNALIIFGIIFILYSLLLASKMGSDSSQKTIVYIIIGLVAIIIATKIVVGGVPQYMWHNEQFGKFTQFIIGPPSGSPNAVSACAGQEQSFIKTMLGITPNPPCCGTGAYWANVRGEQKCKQAILRSNETGAGLPAFLIAGILFFLLFSAFGKNLGFDGLGAGGAKWFPILLSVLLGALIANERVTKNNILRIGGWVALILLGGKLSKTLSGEKDAKGSKKGFGFGLAYAFIQLILNMLGTSLWGGDFSATDVGGPSIIKNLLVGFLIGIIYSSFVGEGIFGRIMQKLSDKQKKDIDGLVEEGAKIKPFLRALPGTGWIKALKPKDSKQKQLTKKVNDDLKKIWDDYVAELTAQNPNPQRLANLKDRIDYEMTVLEEIKKMP